MTARPLPANPSLKSLKNQAKQLVHGHQSGAKDACERIRASHPRMGTLASEEIRETSFALADALLVIAREYGYESWPKLLAEQFSDPSHFSSDVGWEWALCPDLYHPIGSRGGTTSANECMVACENNREDQALAVYVAVGIRYAERDLRAVAFDEEANRHVMRPRGNAKATDLALYGFELPYSEVAHGVITHIGIEVRVP